MATQWTPKVTGWLPTIAGAACAWRMWWGASPSRPALGLEAPSWQCHCPPAGLLGLALQAPGCAAHSTRAAPPRSLHQPCPKSPIFARSTPQAEYHWDIIKQSETKVSDIVVSAYLSHLDTSDGAPSVPCKGRLACTLYAPRLPSTSASASSKRWARE